MGAGFDMYNTTVWTKSGGWTNGGMFNCTWRVENTTFANGQMTLTLNKDTLGGTKPYAGGEYTSKDTTKVQFNYFTNGVGNHKYVYNLGFDASTSFHTYAFKKKVYPQRNESRPSLSVRHHGQGS
ncbi:MAG: family 16 glycosylhydrolase [Clostridiaceae bacterium]|nr:family 16 glycosylhydrolase [Clostridiaceae bacterium]